jgi:HPt (histidine-containing phosphotransfer) domain-containing protein
MVEELTRDFWPDASKMLCSAEEAIRFGDIQRASRELHTLKGVAGTLGFVGLEASAGEAQGALAAQGMADFPKLQADLLRAVAMFAPSPDPAADIQEQRGPSLRRRGDVA